MGPWNVWRELGSPNPTSPGKHANIAEFPIEQWDKMCKLAAPLSDIPSNRIGGGAVNFLTGAGAFLQSFVFG